MEAQPSRKRPFVDDDGGDEDELNRKPPQKKVRFPKGKKVKPGDEVAVANVPQVAEDEPAVLNDAQLASNARSKRKNKNKAAFDIDGKGNILDDVADAEEHYEDDETLEDDGVKIEPFNLEQERKEGFFDQTGNYVEYVANDIKDAWLDSIDSVPNLAQKQTVFPNIVVEDADLSSQEIGSIKRRIADVLKPGETVLQALKRLKGSSSSRKAKMSAETKVVFDQLTEDAMKLMDDGDLNVYNEEQEVFQREAEGFEKLALARGEGTSSSAAADNTSNNEDDFDMFADNDDDKTTVPESDGTGPTHNDYIFDETSGYYYSSSLGYYYDSSSGLYCNAASGLWYSYNQETGTYDEIPAAAETNISS